MVALVVTIVVLIILATITINIALNGGIADKAQKAKLLYENEEEKEQAIFQNVIERMNEIEAKKTGTDEEEPNPTPTEEAEILLDKSTEVVGVDRTIEIIATTKPADAEVKWTSSIDEVATVEGSESGEKKGTVTGRSVGKVTITAQITLGDGSTKEATCIVEVKSRFSELYTSTQTVTDGTATIPNGYAVGISSDVNSEANGLVITDKIEIAENGDNYSIGNEFVWVPVGNINDMVYCQEHSVNGKISYNTTGDKLECSQCKTGNNQTTNLAGKLYASSTGDNFTEGTPNTGYKEATSKSTGIREPDVVTNSTSGNKSTSGSEYDAVADNLKIVLEDYTVGKTVTNFKNQLQVEFNEMAKSVGKYGGFYIGRYETSQDGSKSASKANVKSLINDSSDSNWYGQYKYNKAYAPKKENKSVVSSTIWGCEYDAMMKWMQGNGIDVTSETPKEGVEINGTRTTGATDSKDKLCNIYDLLGNSYEWTIEAFDTYRRVSRGGGCFGSSSPSNRERGYPTLTNGSGSSRLSLYVK